MTSLLGIQKAFASRSFALHPTRGDRRLCDTCTLRPACERYSEGSECTVGEKENNSLATYFGSRRGLGVVDGVANVIGLQAKLLEADIEVLGDPMSSDIYKAISENEKLTENKRAELQMKFLTDLQKRVETRINSLTKNGNTLARLRDPSLSRPTLSVTLNQAAGVDKHDWTQRQLSNALRVLEAKGFPRESITEQMAYTLLEDTNGDPMKELPPARTISVGTVGEKDLGYEEGEPADDIDF